MAKFQSPLLGYNNNVRHKNRIFHIQTEDSGVNHPHIITHLFMDGGRILKSVKKSYAEHVGVDGMSEIVRGMMKEQHKAMFIALRDGQFDHLVGGAVPAPAPSGASLDKAAEKTDKAAADKIAAEKAAAEKAAAEKAAAEKAAAEKAAADKIAADKIAAAVAERATMDKAAAAAAAAADKAAAAGKAAPRPPEPKRPISADTLSSPMTRPDPPRSDMEPAPATFDEGRAAPASATEPKQPRAPSAPAVLIAASSKPVAPRPTSAPPTERRLMLADDDLVERRVAPSAIPREEVPTTTRHARMPSSHELTLDFDALERASVREERPPTAASLFQAHDLPPPPKNLFVKEPGTGTYRAVESPSRAPASGAQPTVVRGPPPKAASRPAADSRYAPARPAAIFGATPKAPPQSIFSDELISDKSLDEVILSYLAEDLDPPRRK